MSYHFYIPANPQVDIEGITNWCRDNIGPEDKGWYIESMFQSNVIAGWWIINDEDRMALKLKFNV
jgi:hypothetical protein